MDNVLCRPYVKGDKVNCESAQIEIDYGDGRKDFALSEARIKKFPAVVTCAIIQDYSDGAVLSSLKPAVSMVKFRVDGYVNHGIKINPVMDKQEKMTFNSVQQATAAVQMAQNLGFFSRADIGKAQEFMRYFTSEWVVTTWKERDEIQELGGWGYRQELSC